MHTFYNILCTKMFAHGGVFPYSLTRVLHRTIATDAKIKQIDAQLYTTVHQALKYTDKQ